MCSPRQYSGITVSSIDSLVCLRLTGVARTRRGAKACAAFRSAMKGTLKPSVLQSLRVRCSIEESLNSSTSFPGMSRSPEVLNWNVSPYWFSIPLCCWPFPQLCGLPVPVVIRNPEELRTALLRVQPSSKAYYT
jgi:hypothetical protein